MSDKKKKERRPSMGEIIREAMDYYWKVVQSPTDKGLSAEERSWKKAHRRDMDRLSRKFFGVKYHV